MKNFKKGFTLIELLVVIAIIGILSSIVLASLSSARTKGEDAALQSTLSSMRAQAELYYSNNNDYGPAATGSCTAGTTIFTNASSVGSLKALTTSANSKTDDMDCYVTGSSTWAVSAKLKTSISGGQYYCVDSSGGAKATTSAIASATCGF